jgi:hypothetical protein
MSDSLLFEHQVSVKSGQLQTIPVALVDAIFATLVELRPVQRLSSQFHQPLQRQLLQETPSTCFSASSSNAILSSVIVVFSVLWLSRNFQFTETCDGRRLGGDA